MRRGRGRGRAGPSERAGRGCGGFTLIELLVVIAIIALLIGILLPALSSARDNARTVEAAAAMRSLMQAYTSYADDHGGEVVPGQDRTATGVTDEFGEALGLLASSRWLYRLGPSFEYQFEGITHVGSRARALENRVAQRANQFGQFANWGYTNSLFPSFGVNDGFAGGWYVNTAGGNEPARPALSAPPSSLRADDAPISQAWYERAVVRRIADVFQPSRFIAFTSARFRDSRNNTEGFHRVEPPMLGTVFDPAATTQGIDTRFGYVDARYGGRAIVGLFDGHAELIRPEEVTDRTRWINEAAMLGDRDFEPPR